MTILAALLNLPWTIAGLILGLLSLPRHMRINKKPLALIVTVRSSWWQTWLPGYKGVRATTTGAVVLLGERLLAHDLEHELVHVTQYQREPFVHAFLYVFASLRHGYRNNKYEIEAYEKAGNMYVEKQAKR